MSHVLLNSPCNDEYCHHGNVGRLSVQRVSDVFVKYRGYHHNNIAAISKTSILQSESDALNAT